MSDQIAAHAGRTVALRGDAAAEWLRERGQEPQSADDLRIFGDEIRFGAFRLARLRHSPLHARVRIPPGIVRVVLVVEGDARIAASDARAAADVGPGDSFVVVGPASGEYRALEAVARYEIDVSVLEVPAGVLRGIGEGVALHPDASPCRAMIMALTNTVLNSDADHATAAGPLSSAVASLVSGLLVDAVSARSRKEPARAPESYSRALGVILGRARDQRFGVAELAEAVNLSSGYLRKVFAAHGSRPSEAIEQARLAIAQRHLAATGSPRRTRAEIATMSGFSSARALSDALARQQRSRSA
ncbi:MULTISPECIES: helix-turn-helix domain-containing protein [unclassified Rathayibacter]|uniref:helix-turn-helix domain-containing protein n=1 Tax=unclassified Rathayibacter TaxID=2609250 RepID=UPI0006F910F8|nr:MULTISPECIES: helix-turn-helix domain-containing protein [unclassified Rathayibacter]KQQ06287.1 hypothetical protein ASF42_07190 [Rathayibacter sp. Leaf294]KQS14142.1 hypothetical protein ASG06_07190 [Rathayibacter sp. Leaf185]